MKTAHQVEDEPDITVHLDSGPLTVLRPNTVLAWRSGSWAGRDGFERSGSRAFD